MARSATSHVGLSIYCLDLDGPRLAASKAVTKNCSHSTIELKHLGESEMSDESNADRTEDREMLRETLSRMQDETRRGIEDLRQIGQVREWNLREQPPILKLMQGSFLRHRGETSAS